MHWSPSMRSPAHPRDELVGSGRTATGDPTPQCTTHPTRRSLERVVDLVPLHGALRKLGPGRRALQVIPGPSQGDGFDILVAWGPDDSKDVVERLAGAVSFE
eukprot:CAMPEP_0175958458 /NCGR_PEP_ID=MMETSP0108-20121206/34258_1 /TAXON_ID=195067 ORGANISM="Goniomonas pacifica, Strain CCMP1869" /NCGR_SAMPLE_ID=MMETSP0108 /ASSEMBLY_ACC=CAM_ASM_000204 /LENGTH=101 /DNA_ID=CAMNT_0017285813 /DNA_START=440 /DNA_END=746 /DNA_ORIENTATION=-